MDSAVIMFAKAPIAGLVKTRLCPPLTSDEAATLHGSFVLDTAERSREAQARARFPFDRVMFCSPSPDHVYFKILEARHGVRLSMQTGDDLGASMLHAFETMFAQGYRRAILVGTDVPTLPPESYPRALDLLNDHDLVLGPATDGGYYLIGLRRAIPELFRGIPWSTPDVLPTTRHRAEALGLRTVLVEARRDIDRLEDLLALIEEAGLGARGGRQTARARHLPPPAARGVPRADAVSARTAGVLRTLAQRLRERPA